MKINLCGIGNPHNPRVWSGTPYNILNALQEQGSFASAFSSDEDKLLNRLLKYCSSIYYQTPLSWERRSQAVRALNAYTSVRKTRKSVSNHTLHFGTADLPFKTPPKDQHHYIFCDSTWDLWYSQATTRHLYSSKMARLSEKLEKMAFEQVDHIFPISEYVKANLVDHYKIAPSKITVVGAGTGIIRPYHGDKDYNNGRILFVAKGRFEDKGGSLVLEAFKKAWEKNPSLQLSIVGQKEYSQLATHPNITTYGFIPVEKLQELFNTHSLFVMPALNEPWGLVYVEAVLCRMPIVGLNRNSFPEISNYGRFGIGLDTPDAGLLADVLLTAFADTQKLSQMGSAAQDHALKNFSWKLTAQKIINKINLLEEER